MKKGRHVAAIGLLCLAGLAQAGGDNDLDELQSRIGKDWVLVKDDRVHRIKTWIKQEDGKRMRSFRIEAYINGRIEDYVRMALDIEGLRRWYYQVTDSRLLKKVSATEYVTYMVHRAPPGSPDRDVISSLTYVPQTDTKKTLEIKARAMPGYLPAKPPLVRMLAEDYVTVLTPVGRNLFRQDTEGYIDPGGNEPAWSINFIQRIAPYNTQVSIYRRLQQGADLDRSTPLPFVVHEADYYQ